MRRLFLFFSSYGEVEPLGTKDLKPDSLLAGDIHKFAYNRFTRLRIAARIFS